MLREATCRQQHCHTRICRACGYGGRELQRRHLTQYFCPRCGCDLYARPPRSYAEMEGFAPAPAEAAKSSEAHLQKRRKLGRGLDRASNWGAVSFILVLLLVIAAQSIVMALQAAA